MPALTVQMFGKFCVRRHETRVNAIDASKLQELLSYMLVYRETPHAREALATLLWGETSTTQSKKYLRQALWQLQSALDSQDEKRNRIFEVDAEWISINPDADISVDVAIFERASASARDVAGQSMDSSLAEKLETAVQLYQGDFLEGWYQDWCLCERERLQAKLLMMLNKLMNYCEAHEKYETGVAHGMRVLRYDRARESTHRRLMRLHYLARDRTAALRQYEHCVTALNEELGVKPSRLTVNLYDQIRLDEPVTRTVVTTRSAQNVLPRVVDHLQHVRQALMKIHAQVQKDIKAVEEALDEWK